MDANTTSYNVLIEDVNNGTTDNCSPNPQVSLTVYQLAKPSNKRTDLAVADVGCTEYVQQAVNGTLVFAELTAVDESFNTAKASAPIKFMDVSPPTAQCASDYTVYLAANGIGSVDAPAFGSSSTDVCIFCF